MSASKAKRRAENVRFAAPKTPSNRASESDELDSDAPSPTPPDRTLQSLLKRPSFGDILQTLQQGDQQALLAAAGSARRASFDSESGMFALTAGLGAAGQPGQPPASTFSATPPLQMPMSSQMLNPSLLAMLHSQIASGNQAAFGYPGQYPMGFPHVNVMVSGMGGASGGGANSIICGGSSAAGAAAATRDAVLVPNPALGIAGSVDSGGGGVEVEVVKKEQRLQKNRQAAKECRRKKKEFISQLEKRIEVLSRENETLNAELATARARVKELEAAK
jgi:hypothetical protein